MKFRKKPVVIDAVQWNGYNFPEVANLFKGSERECKIIDDCLAVSTLEGVMKANKMDWIIKGVKGELYPCKPDIFKATYEPVVDNE